MPAPKRPVRPASSARPMTAARTARARALPAMSLPAWAVLCFFASGAAGLLYEVVWSKQLAYLLGNSLQAVATVVAAFLCGLALGARVLGVPLSRRGDGPRTYARLELAVGVLGLALLPALRGLEPLVGNLYRSLGGEGTAFALARFALLFLVLIPPAALMGATLPVLVGHFERTLVGPGLARLYALNTFGAVAGSVLGGFALLPGLGLMGTTVVAAAVNVVVAAIAWSRGTKPAAAPAVSTASHADRAAPEPAPAVPASVTAPPDALPGASHAVVALLFALSGFAALAFQIAWVRLFSLMFGSSVYSFSAVLGVYLLGLALGSALVAGLLRGGASLAAFARIQLALAVVTALVLHAFSRLPQWTFDLAERSGAHWQALFAGEVWMLALLLLVPCALLGAAFPLAARLLQRGDGGHATGFAYAVNTAGTIAGSLAAGFLLVPRVGVQGTHVVALVLSLAIGLGALLVARARREPVGRDLAFGVVALAAVVALVVSAPRWDPSTMSSGPYRPVQASNLIRHASTTPGVGQTVYRATRLEKVLFYRDGINGSVLVASDKEGLTRWLSVGGKVDASTGDMETQVMLGLLPAALADSGARALVIGLGSGFTAASVLAAGAGPTEIVEIEPAVVEASRWFHGPGESPLEDPRTRLVLGDARTHLAHGRGTYDLIVSEPSNPWIAGVNNLFTVDFYRHVKRRLAPDGVFCQWMQLYELSPETFGSMVASFREVFPEARLFCIWRSVDVLLIAAPEDAKLDLARLGSPAARRMLERAKIRAPELVAGFYAGPLSALAGATRGAPLNRDDRPIVEYRAPRDMVEVGRAALHGDPKVAGLVPFADARPSGALFADWTDGGWLEARGQLLADQADETRVSMVLNQARRAGHTEVAARIEARIDGIRRRTQALQEVSRAVELVGQGRMNEVRQILERAVVLDPTDAHTWLMLADQRRAIKDFAGAEEALAHGRASEDKELQADAAMLTGMVEMDRQQPLVAAAHFLDVQKLSPQRTKGYALEARARLVGGDRAGALEALKRGLVQVPGDPDLSSALASLGATP